MVYACMHLPDEGQNKNIHSKSAEADFFFQQLKLKVIVFIATVPICPFSHVPHY